LREMLVEHFVAIS